ncbi:MAG TPA: TM0106 family RecB-like putative nuclease [Acidimicrobiales bacterium]|nr:TM0106 family RecB-like putative nuclease [Acidimicrobiales bacterium]
MTATTVRVELTPRNAYFAKACPERVQLAVLRPAEPLPDSPFLQKLIAEGIEHEDETVDAFFAGVEGAVEIAADDPGTRERLTLRALADGAPVVAGGRLPVDDAGHRVGEPDLLVRHGAGYVPVDVKAHKSLGAAKPPATGTALVSGVTEPFPAAAVIDPDVNPRKHVGDQLQLAHYRRLLEAAGLASPSANIGGICGSEGVIVWYDLDEPWLGPPEYLATAPAGPLSAMERYDLDFDLRLDVHLAALAHVESEGSPLLAEPIVCEQCALCRWRAWCGERLDATADLSLISGVDVVRRRFFKAHGVDDLHALAALDWTTADLVRADVDLAGLLAEAERRPPTTPLAAVIPNRKKQLEYLAAAGLFTVADTSAVDRRTLDLALAGASNLAGQIDLARARVGAAAAYRRRGVGRIDVPRGDVEVDVDMESTNQGCYLWGALVTDRRVGASGTRYVACATWDPDVARGELDAFAEFWAWFTGERARAHAEGATFRAYCYSRSAEEGQMKRIAARLGVSDEVDGFLASGDWVDLLEVVRGHLVTGRSLGLKETAPLAGFAWRSEDIGGDLAMVNYDVAVDAADPVAAAEARRWILEYNEDDVGATAALRTWLDGPANELPSIADAAPTPAS